MHDVPLSLLRVGIRPQPFTHNLVHQALRPVAARRSQDHFRRHPTKNPQRLLRLVSHVGSQDDILQCQNRIVGGEALGARLFVIGAPLTRHGYTPLRALKDQRAGPAVPTPGPIHYLPIFVAVALLYPIGLVVFDLRTAAGEPVVPLDDGPFESSEGREI
jgi:hypothetical protein